MQTEIISIEHRYSDKEMASLAREQAEALNEIKTLEDRLSAIKKDIGARIDEKKAVVNTKSNRIATGMEFRDVRCLLLKEQPTGHQIGIRCDTARIVKYRRLRMDERQLELDGQQPRIIVASAVLHVETKEMPYDALRNLRGLFGPARTRDADRRRGAGFHVSLDRNRTTGGKVVPCAEGESSPLAEGTYG